MTLLAPVAGLVALVAGGAGLLAMYLLKLQRRTLRVGSTMLWEQAARDLQVNVPLRMLRPSWVLLLHAAAVLLAAAAVGRPAVDSGAAAAERVIVVIDRSASMRADDGAGGGTRLDAARARAVEIIDRAARSTPRPRMTVAAFAAEAEALEMDADGPARARAAVAGISASDEPGDLGQVVGLLRAMLTSDGPEDPEAAGRRAMVHILTDGGGPPAPGLAADLPAGVTVVFEPVTRRAAGETPTAPLNLGLTAVAATRDFADPVTLRVFARIESNAERDTATTITASRDGVSLAAATVRVPAASGSGLGETVWTTSLTDAAGGPLQIALSRPDGLAADNTAWVVVPPIRRPRIGVVIAPAAAGPDAFMLDVLEALEPAVLRVIRWDGADGTPLAWAGYDVMIFDEVMPTTAPAVPSVSFGASVPGLAGPADGPRGAIPLGGGARPVLSWARSHPLLRDVGFGDVLVGAAVTLPEPDAPGVAGGWSVLARGEQGPLVMMRDGPGGDGIERVVVGFPLRASTWSLDVGFPIFLAATIDRLSGGGTDASAGRFFTTGDVVRVPLPGPSAGDTVAVTGPITRQVGVNAGATAANLGRLPLAGLYRAGWSSGEQAVAVNLVSADETSLAIRGPISPAERAGAPAGAAGPGGDERARRELWPWFVLAALVVLTADWLLYAWWMRV